VKLSRKRQPTAARSEWSSCRGGGGGADVRSSKASWGWMKLVLSATKMVTIRSTKAGCDGDPVGELLSRLAQPFATAQSLLGQGLREFSPVTVIVYNWLAVSQRQVCCASQARFHPNCRTSGGIGRSGSRLAGAGETPVCLVVSSPRWHLVSSRFERGGCTDSLTSP